MELRHLRAFEAAVRCGSFTQAAAELGLSQPAVSLQVQALERELGIELLERLPRRVLLTPAGEALLDYARRLLNLEAEAGQVIAELKGLQAGCLRVAASPTIGTYLLPAMLGEFKRRQPGLRVIAEIAPSYRVGHALHEHAADVGLVEAPVDSESLVAEVFRTDELVLIVPAAHPWAGRRAILPRELAGQPLIAREPASGTRALVEERLRALGVEITPALELGGVEAIKNAVAAGLGVSFVSRHALELEVRLGILAAIPVRGLNLQRPFYCLRHSRRYASPALEAFLAFVREAGQAIRRMPPAPSGSPPPPKMVL